MSRNWLVRLFFLNFVRFSAGNLCATCVCTILQDGTRVADCQGKISTLRATELDIFFILKGRQQFDRLILSKNNISSLPPGSLRNFTQLGRLDLSRNFLSEINVQEFADLTSVHQLDLSINGLKELDGALLDALPSLSELNVSRNGIETLKPPAKSDSSQLRLLDVSHNGLTDLNVQFLRSFPNLRYLDASFNKIEAVDLKELTNLKDLQVLRLVDNALLSLNLAGISRSLKELYVGYNALSSLPYEAPEVEVLNIEYNSLSELDAAVEKFARLKCLNVSGNSLKSFPNVSMSDLRNLDISYNDLPTIPRSLSSANFPRLEALNISGNLVENLHFPVKIRLATLAASELPSLATIDEATLANLEVPLNDGINLILSNNKYLSTIHERAFDHLNITFLDLNHNRIESISRDLVVREKRLRMRMGIDLQGNPLRCDCSSQWMLDTLVSQLYDLDRKLLEDLRCQTPWTLADMRMVHWYNWKGQIFCENSSTVLSKMIVSEPEESISNVMIGSTIGLLVVLAISITIFTILVVVGIVLTRRLVLKMRRRNRKH